MTLATPGRVTTAPPHAPSGRASALLLLPAAAVCGFGLGLAGLAALAPAPVTAPLPPLGALAAAPGTVAEAPAERPDWAALFGTRPEAAPEPEPAPEAEEAPEPAHDPMDDFDPGIYVLRGLAVPTDEVQGFALLETPDTAMVVHIGDLLPEGYEVVDITPDGIVIDVFGEEFVIGFQEDALSVDGDAYDGEMGDDYEGPSVNYRDRPRPQPRDPDEGLSPPRERYPRDYPGDGPSEVSRRDRLGISR